jgi:hypothetical protein
MTFTYLLATNTSILVLRKSRNPSLQAPSAYPPISSGSSVLIARHHLPTLASLLQILVKSPKPLKILLPTAFLGFHSMRKHALEILVMEERRSPQVLGVVAGKKFKDVVALEDGGVPA